MTLVDTATVWASAGALIGGTVVWLAFVYERKKSRESLHRGVGNLIVGLEAELDLLRGWATGGESGLGYPLHGDEEESRLYYWNAEPGWRQPQRFILPVPFPTIEGLVTSRYASHLREIIPSFVNLSFAVRALFKIHEEYRQFVLSQSSIFAEVVTLINENQGKKLNAEIGAIKGGHQFLRQVFEYNHQMHVHRIGTPESDPGCLFPAYARARLAFDKFSRRWKKPSEPLAYAVGHLIAALFFLAGALLIGLWFVAAITPGIEPGSREIIFSWPWK